MEVDGALLRHPTVQELAIVGIPDERWGEAPHAFVVLKAAGHFQTVTNSDLRFQTSDSEHEQERCIRASSFLRHSSFVIRHSAFEACPSRQARDFEAVTGLTIQLTDGGPSVTPGLPGGAAGPPFGRALGWAVSWP